MPHWSHLCLRELDSCCGWWEEGEYEDTVELPVYEYIPKVEGQVDSARVHVDRESFFMFLLKDMRIGKDCMWIGCPSSCFCFVRLHSKLEGSCCCHSCNRLFHLGLIDWNTQRMLSIWSGIDVQVVPLAFWLGMFPHLKNETNFFEVAEEYKNQNNTLSWITNELNIWGSACLSSTKGDYKSSIYRRARSLRPKSSGCRPQIVILCLFSVFRLGYEKAPKFGLPAVFLAHCWSIVSRADTFAFRQPWSHSSAGSVRVCVSGVPYTLQCTAGGSCEGLEGIWNPSNNTRTSCGGLGTSKGCCPFEVEFMFVLFSRLFGLQIAQTWKQKIRWLGIRENGTHKIPWFGSQMNSISEVRPPSPPLNLMRKPVSGPEPGRWEKTAPFVDPQSWYCACFLVLHVGEKKKFSKFRSVDTLWFSTLAYLLSFWQIAGLSSGGETDLHSGNREATVPQGM